MTKDNLLPYTIDNEQNFHELQIIDESSEDDNLFDDLINNTKKVLFLLEEQKLAGNTKWCKAVKKSFNPIIKLVEEVKQYQRK